MENYKEKYEALLVYVEQLLQRIDFLESEVARLKNKPNSKNSFMSPSADITRQNKVNPNRIKSGKKPGGQPGHKGNFLEMRTHVDEIIENRPGFCHSCGKDLTEIAGTELNRGQIIDLPVIKTKVIEYVNYSTKCPCCKAMNKTELPGTLGYCNIQYGQNIKDFIVFLSTRHFIPIARIKEIILAITGESISTGFINNCIDQKSLEMQPVYEEILKKIQSGTCVHADETGMRIKDEKGWMWYWGTELWKYFRASKDRGFNTVKEVLGNITHDFVLVSDRWAAQLKTDCADHQLCLVHLIRDCNKYIEQYNSKWAGKLKCIFEKIIRIKNEGKNISPNLIDSIETRLTELLESQLIKSHDKILVFRNQMRKLKRYITTCLWYDDVPAQNKLVEQSIRNVKLKTKISTNFRSEQGAQNYAINRSIIDTAISQGLNVFDVLRNPNLIFN